MSTNFRNVLPFVSRHNVHVRYLLVSRLLLLVAKYALYRDLQTLISSGISYILIEISKICLLQLH